MSVKEAVLPFNRFPGVDTLLGPEMRSTGEVMGIGATFGLAFAKSQIAAGNRLPVDGTVFLSLADRDKAGRPGGGPPVRRPWGSSWRPRRGRRPCSRPTASRWRRWWPRWATPAPGWSTPSTSSPAGKVQLVVNTPRGRGPRADGLHIRAAALAHLVPCLTTVAAARAAAAGIADWVSHPLSVRSLQEYHQR